MGFINSVGGCGKERGTCLAAKGPKRCAEIRSILNSVRPQSDFFKGKLSTEASGGGRSLKAACGGGVGLFYSEEQQEKGREWTTAGPTASII